MVLKKLLFCSLFFYSAAIGAVSEYWQKNLSTQEESLLFYSWSIYSQCGEEGILDEIVKRLHLKEGLFLEYSSFYASSTSNVRFLAERGWQGLFIDVTNQVNDYKKCAQYIVSLAPILCLEEILYFKDVAHLPQVCFIKSSNNSSELMRAFCQDKEVDILSIDISGFDERIMEEIKNKPKVVIIKSGMYWSPVITSKVPSEIAVNGVNQPLTFLVGSMKREGYTPVCFTGNVVFVRDDLIGSFDTIIKDPGTLWMDSWHYFSEKQPSYISWLTEIRACNRYMQQFDPDFISQ